MKTTLRIAVAQIDCTVGDLAGNERRIVDSLARAARLGVDIVSLPELAVTGYPPEDLLLKRSFVDANRRSVDRIARRVGDMTAVVGFVDRDGRGLYNAAALMYRGAVRAVYRKMRLPNYGVFDEKRYFVEGDEMPLFRFRGILFGVAICEDIWQDGEIPAALAAAGARLLVTVNSSPYHRGRTRERERLVIGRARKYKLAVSYANIVGGQDELVFDGQSLIVDSRGTPLARGRAFGEDFIACDLSLPAAKGVAAPRPGKRPRLPAAVSRPLAPVAEVYAALKLGLTDYTAKSGFSKAVIAVSGGIDSALVAALAVDCLGPENVVGVFMPSRYTAERSAADARELTRSLGIRLIAIPIDPLFRLALMSLETHFSGRGRDTAEENLQARLRGTLIMTLSNKFGWLVLTTGNKSEMSTGYATLYGDMAGGFAVIKDVPKTLVYKLAAYRNTLGAVIPRSIITREPTAELRPGQTDRDTLPPYGMLDRILKAYVEEDKAYREIVRMGFNRQTVARVIGMVDRSEYKRRQAPPGIRITPKAFGKDRRMPITNKYTQTEART